MVNAGANVNIGGQIDNRVPLMAHACSLNVKPEVIRYLIQQNTNIHEANENGFAPVMSPLLEAVEHENIGSVRVNFQYFSKNISHRFTEILTKFHYFEEFLFDVSLVSDYAVFGVH